MKFTFRSYTIFEYDPETKDVKQHKVMGVIPGFDYCSFITEDYKGLSIFFKRVAVHREGGIKTEELKDIEVY